MTEWTDLVRKETRRISRKTMPNTSDLEILQVIGAVNGGRLSVGDAEVRVMQIKTRRATYLTRKSGGRWSSGGIYG